MNPKDREQIEDDIETPENTDEPETVDETDEDEDAEDEDAEEDEEESEEEDDEESEEEDDDGDDEDDDEDEEDEDDDEDEDLKGVGERAKKRIGKLTGEVKDLKRELEEARKLTGDDGRAILAAAETAGILPQLMSADEAKGIKELDSKTSAKKYLKKLLRSDDDEFEIGGETRSRRWVQGELDDLEEEIGELRERYGAKRRELAEKSKRIFELGMAAQKAGWKPGEKGAEKKGAARKPHKGQKATKAAKPARKGLSFINRKKGGKKDLDWGSVTDDASAEAMLLAEMED
ncbi:MAG: hypothetical protein J5727_03465 [Kiritimatiellae bacterium]|nr:hypothetical protein [Kiritimatiellia bacterium]